MSGLEIHAQATISDLAHADAVLIGSGMRTREIVVDSELMARLKLNPQRQLLGAQCSGALVLAKLGILNAVPACTDLTTKPWVVEAGVNVLDQPFFASGNIATAGGCLASIYLAGWVISRLCSPDEARRALHYVAPVGEKEDFVEKFQRNVVPYLG
jgi:transcriptional regulator GlxA family with amidase domain